MTIEVVDARKEIAEGRELFLRLSKHLVNEAKDTEPRSVGMALVLLVNSFCEASDFGHERFAELLIEHRNYRYLERANKLEDKDK